MAGRRVPGVIRHVPVFHAPQEAADELQVYRMKGKHGGDTTKARHGPGFYAAIGSKGGRTTKRRRLQRAIVAALFDENGNRKT